MRTHPVAVLIQSMWIVWLLYWLISARHVKRSRQIESIGSFVVYRVPLLVGTILILVPDVGLPIIETPIFPRNAVFTDCMVVLVAAGLGFAIWARRHLAENWSARVTVKEDHELIRTGPYRWVRHPIYTGMLLALAATALAIDTWQAAIAFVLFLTSFVIKLLIEERVMTATFGDQYSHYKSETARLIPYVW